MRNKLKFTLAYLCILILTIIGSKIYAHVPTANILQRVFALRVGIQQGTAFTIDVDSKQYLVTAGHLFTDTNTTQTVHIYHDSTWHKLKVKLVAPLSDSVDVAVLALVDQLSPTHELPTSTAGMVIGQEVYFLGFPSMLRTEVANNQNRGFPIPFIKHAIVSALGRDKFGNQIIYLDGHNNPGFSGGPVVFWNKKLGRFCLAGVINSFRTEKLLIRDSSKVFQKIDLYGNSGIVLTTEVKAILKIIKQNPIGAQLK